MDFRSISAAFIVVVVGCGGSVTEGTQPDVGGESNFDVDSAATDTMPTRPDGTPLADTMPALPDGAKPVDDGITGTWTGYVESYKFPSGSDALTLVLASDGAGNVAGTISLGAGTPPPVATDPEVAIPQGPTGGCGGGGPYPIIEALPFVLHEGSIAGTRLRFSVLTTEAWKPFCELQTKTFLVSPGLYQCVPNTGCSSGPTCSYGTPPTPVDCGKYALCAGRGCTCTATGCTVSGPGDASFDLVVASGAANGSTTGRFGDKIIHLTRMK